jgi:hypothetical protein
MRLLFFNQISSLFSLLLAFFRFFSLRFASFSTPFSLENELFAILRKHAKQTLFFRYFASPKFATFSHLFSSSENLGDTLVLRRQA